MDVFSGEDTISAGKAETNPFLAELQAADGRSVPCGGGERSPQCVREHFSGARALPVLYPEV